jgi:hypothetical protein
MLTDHENGLFRGDPEKLVYPFGTRSVGLVDGVDDKGAAFAGLSEKPSDGLEPSTPSLPCRLGRSMRTSRRQ